MQSKSVTVFFLSSYGCNAVHTAPSPSDSTAKRMFSVAALQSCTQNSESAPPHCLFVSPATTIPAEACAAIFAYGNPAASFPSIDLLLISMNSQGRLSTAVGADIPALIIRSSVSLPISPCLNSLTLFLLNIVSSVLFIIIFLTTY